MGSCNGSQIRNVSEVHIVEGNGSKIHNGSRGQLTHNKDAYIKKTTEDAVLTLTIIALSGELLGSGEGTFEVPAASQPWDLLWRMHSEGVPGLIDTGSERSLVMRSAVLDEFKSFAEQDVPTGATLTLIIMPYGAQFLAENFDPEQLHCEEGDYTVSLFYAGTEFLCQVGSYEHTYRLSASKRFLSPVPRFNAPLFACRDMECIDVLQHLKMARAKGLIK
jgi:hypothetical protein